MFGRGARTVTVKELAVRMQTGTPVIIDVREPREFAAGHVPGAVNVPLASVPGALDRFDRDAETFVICQHGRRSLDAARMLARNGFRHVYSVAGGTSAWTGSLQR